MSARKIGWLLIVHGLAHAALIIWSVPAVAPWIVSLTWAVAITGYLAAGLAWMRAPLLKRYAIQLLALATIASLCLLVLSRGWITLVGILLDAAILTIAGRQLRGGGPHSEEQGASWHTGWIAGFLLLAYCIVVVAIRPTYLTWGTTAFERSAPLLGDDFVPAARYRVDHGITINAPADAIWPWLVQLGQDRGGFYSYDILERMVGDDIHNADRIHPEWQHLREGDLIRAVQPRYLGGIFGDSVGWRVQAIDPGRALLLEKWGAFVLVPMDEHSTRFLVRSRGDGAPSLAGFLLGPFNVFVFEPMHFIMQREMLRGVKRRAESPPA